MPSIAQKKANALKTYLACRKAVADPVYALPSFVRLHLRGKAAARRVYLRHLKGGAA